MCEPSAIPFTLARITLGGASVLPVVRSISETWMAKSFNLLSFGLSAIRVVVDK